MEFQDAAEFLRSHDQFLVLTHRRPDGDTLGCAGALCHALRRLGKSAYMFPNREITETYLPFVEKYFAPVDFVPQTVAAVDIADYGLLPLGFQGEIDLWIDHHASRSERSPALVWPHKAACGEIVLELIEALLGKPDQEEADLLYIAVSTDTGCFCYANTNADTFRAAARLMDSGAHLKEWNKLLFRTKSRSRLKLEGLIFSTMRSYRDGAINVAVVPLQMLRDAEATENDCDDISNLAGLVQGNRAAITVRELPTTPPRSKVSLRTDGSVDASLVCARFGGGGHKMASGCEIPLPPQEAAEAVRAVVEELWP
ncbi:MAG: bifunctional oligoribonuclease/PAP phosphatase NrnA [Oscillospiraceae bacterium]|nr:bifunctional oligoribonuclease/PAP phosphatase NrnA [Oscillospiraceae bacterium]